MGHWYFIYLRLRRNRFKKVKISSADQTIFNKEYVRFDERGHKNIMPKPFLKPAMEMAMKKIFKKKRISNSNKYSIDDLLDYLNQLSGRNDFNTDKDQLKLAVIKDMLINLCMIKFNGDFKTKDLY